MTAENTLAVIDFGVTTEQVAAKTALYTQIDFATPVGYKEGTSSLREVVSTRTAIDAKRAELKAPALEYGRKVDAAAKAATALLAPLEKILRDKKDAVDNERQRKLDAIKADEDRRIAEAEQRRQAEQAAKIKADREAEEARLRADREKLDAERAELDAARERQRQEQRDAQAKIDAARRELEQAQQRERDRQAEQVRQQESAAKIDRDQLEQERQAALRAEQERHEAARLESLKPDAEKLHAWAAEIRHWFNDNSPAMTSPDGLAALASADAMISECVDFLNTFGTKGP